jgi:thiol-disulfide isomerase/thioredoxin
MKKYLVFLLLPLMVACVKGPKEAVISGTLKNYKDSIAFLTSKGITETIKLNADKSFTFKTSIEKPMLYTFRAGGSNNIEIYMVPGDSAIFVIDFEYLKEGPKFSGYSDEIYKFSLTKKEISKKFITSYRDLYQLPLVSFNTKLDSLENELIESTKNLSILKIAELEAIRADYFVKSIKAEYPAYNAYYRGVEFNKDSADYSFYNGLDANNAYHLMFPEYDGLISRYITSKLIKDFEPNYIDSVPANERIAMFFSKIEANITNIEVRDYLKQTSFMEDLSYGEFWKLSEQVSKYIAECQTVGYKNIIEKIFNEKMLLAPGTKAPLFKYKDINGKEYALEDLKGKLVYIDFWATWCGPCRHELPFLEEIEKAYKGKNITFISMSLDDDMVAWDKMVKEKKMLGLQLHADSAWRSTVAKDYQIKGIPTFFLIDHNGIIISPSAPRPSAVVEIKKLFDENLAKIK